MDEVEKPVLDFAQGKKQLVQAGKRDWRELAMVILECERGRLWKGEASSFSAWLKRFADQLGIQIANLWRYRRAAKAAFVFWGEQGQRRIYKIMDIPEGISPESIEILEKISRAAPAYLVKSLAARLFDKEVPIRELRAIWKQFKPALQGDARGRGKVAPSLSRVEGKRRGALFEKLAADALSQINPIDLGSRGAVSLRVVNDVVTDDKRCKSDLVLLVRNEDGGVDVHGVELLLHPTPGKMDWLHHLRHYCDFVWVVLPNMPSAEINAQLDDWVGLIHIQELNCDVLRQAEKLAPDLSEKMLRRVLAKLVG